MGSDRDGRTQCQAQVSVAREAVICQESFWDQLSSGAFDIKLNVVRPPSYRCQQRRTAHPPTIVRGTHKFSPVPRSLGKEEGSGETICH